MTLPPTWLPRSRATTDLPANADLSTHRPGYHRPVYRRPAYRDLLEARLAGGSGDLAVFAQQAGETVYELVEVRERLLDGLGQTHIDSGLS